MQCPWPLNANTEEEIRIHDDLNSSSSTSGKKRKKEKYKEKENCLGDSLSDNLEKIDSLVESDKCKSPNSKKLKLTKSDPSESVVNPDENSCSIDAEARSTSKSKRLGNKEKDILNYINENFNNSPKPVLTVGDVVEEELDPKTDIVENPIVEKDEFQFKAMPVAVRAPIKLPRHASNILSSRLDSEKKVVGEQSERDEEGEDGDSDLECSLLSDQDESDSELESLVSECSTMTAASETSSLGDLGEGTGKKKRRGKKKKRKDRRKQHAGKCTKEQHRQSDLAMLITDDTEDTEESKSKTELVSDICPSVTAETNKEENEEVSVAPVNEVVVCESEEVQREDIIVVEQVEPVLSAMSTSSTATGPPFSSMSVSSSKVTPAASSMSLESDTEEKKVTGMSVTPDNHQQEPITESPDTHQPISDQQPPEIVVRSPETDDEEMADLSKFQVKWNTFTDPLSPMSPAVVSVGDDQDLMDRDAPLTLKTHPTKKRTPTVKKTSLPAPSSSSKDDTTVFKQPLASPSPARPVSHPSVSSNLSSNLTSSKHPSLPNISGKNTSSQKTSAVKITKSKGLDSILNNLTKKTVNVEHEAPKEVPKPKSQPLPDGPYPRRRGRKSAAHKFSVSSDSETSDRDSLSRSPASSTCNAPTKLSSAEPTTATTPRRGRGRPPKNKNSPKPVETEQPLPPPVAASSPRRVSKKVDDGPTVTTVGPSSTVRKLVPCTPPPGLRLVPCKPPKHLTNKMRPGTSVTSSVRVMPPPTSQGNTTITTNGASTSRCGKANPTSLFDIDESDDLFGKVQKALEKQNENNGPRVENPSTSDDAEVTEDPPLTKISKPQKTFSRVPKKQPHKDMKEIQLVSNINFETVLVPQEASIELPTLSMVSFESDDPDYALVKKLGAGVKKESAASRQPPRPGAVTSTEASSGPAKGDNSVVFHVASQAMISQPTASDNLEVSIMSG